MAEVVNHVVFADPGNADARALQADALEQLGYQAESGPWRNFYLTAAQELRSGVAPLPVPSSASLDVVRAMSLDLFLDYLGVRLNCPKAAAYDLSLNLVFPDVDETYGVILGNGALSHRPGVRLDDADATVTVERATLDRIVLGMTTLDAAVAAGEVTIDGDTDALQTLMGLLDTFEFWFDIVTP